MEITNKISLIEAIWTGAALVGFFYALKLFRGAARDFMAIRARKINSIREYAATATIIGYSIPLMMEFSFAVVGIISMTYPSPPHAPITTRQWVVLGVFMSSTVASTILLAALEHMRQNLLKKLKKSKAVQV